MRRLLWPSVALAADDRLSAAVRHAVSSSGLGALVLLYAIAASAWNIVGGYAGQGFGRACRVSLAAALMRRWAAMRISRCRR